MLSGGSQSVRIDKKYLKVKTTRKDNKQLRVSKIHMSRRGKEEK